MHKSLGIPLAEGLETTLDLPHTISFAVKYREQIESYYNLPKDKRPPRNLWDKPHLLEQYMNDIFKTDGKDSTSTQFYDVDDEELD